MQNRRILSPGRVYFWLLVAFLYLPIALLIIFSFNDSVTLRFPLVGFTLDWYRQMITEKTLLQSVVNSLLVGIGSSFLATVLGTMGAIAVVRFDFPGRELFVGLSAIPLVIPSIVLGVALLIVFRQLLDVELSLWTVALGHVVINVPVAMLIVASRLAGFPDNLEEAAMDLGTTYWGTIWRVTLPMSFPALVAAFLTSFTTSFDEYAMSVFVIGTNPTLPVYLYSQLRFPRRLPIVVTLAAILMVSSIVIVLVAEWLRRVGQPSAKPKGKKL